MRRKWTAILAVLLVFLMAASSALAFEINETDRAVYANGDDITITGDGAGNHTVKSSTQEDTYSGNDYTIYGGKKNEDHDGDTNVTIGEGAIVAGVYGGGKNGDVDGNTNVVIDGGTVNGDVYGGGHATATGNENKTANVSDNASVTVEGGTVNGDVYGGGNAEATASGLLKNSQATANTQSTDVTVEEDGTVNGDVHGGGKAVTNPGGLLSSANATANVSGKASVTIKGEAEDVYGGGDKGDVGSASVTVDGGKVDTVHGGSKKGKVKGNTSVTIKGDATVSGDVYGGGKDGDVAGKTDVTLSGGTVGGNVYGGGENGDVKGDGGTSVTLSGAAISGNAYGGSRYGSVKKSAISMSGGSVNTIYSGSSMLGGVSTSVIQITGGAVLSGDVYGWGDNWLFTTVDSASMQVSHKGARAYTFYLPRCMDGQNAISLSGPLQWDTVVKSATLWDWLTSPFLPYKLSAPNDRSITVTTNYVYTTTEGSTIVNSHTTSPISLPAGDIVIATPFLWNGDGIYQIGDIPADREIDYGFNGDTVVFNIDVTLIPVNTDDDIPLRPGTTQPQIPLGPDAQIPLGVPSTGDTSGMLGILMLAGASLTVMRRKKK